MGKEWRFRFYKRLRLNFQKDFIIFATQPVGRNTSRFCADENELLLRNVLSAFEGLPNQQLVIKLHPFEKDAMYKKVLKETNAKDVVLVQHIDGFDLIDASILVVTSVSTFGLEAMIRNKPVITINIAKRRMNTLAETGAALGVYLAEDIRPAIERVLMDKALTKHMEIKRREMVSRYIYKLDGCASERVVKLINKMSNEEGV